MTGIIKRLAHIACIELTEEEEKQFEKELARVLEAFDVLVRAPSSSKRSVHPVLLNSSSREDKPEKCLPHDAALANTPHKEGGFIKGPRTV